MTKRIAELSGLDLDALAHQHDVEPRGVGEPDTRLRYRIQSQIDYGRYVSPWDADASALVDLTVSRSR